MHSVSCSSSLALPRFLPGPRRFTGAKTNLRGRSLRRPLKRACCSCGPAARAGGQCRLQCAVSRRVPAHWLPPHVRSEMACLSVATSPRFALWPGLFIAASLATRSPGWRKLNFPCPFHEVLNLHGKSNRVQYKENADHRSDAPCQYLQSSLLVHYVSNVKAAERFDTNPFSRKAALRRSAQQVFHRNELHSLRLP